VISPAALVADLKKQVLLLEDDLRQRITLPEFDQPWRSEHAAATSGDRTAATYTAWADDRITQAAVSWVLTTVFVRFCEDNRLLTPVWIAGPGHRYQEALDAELAYFRRNPEDTHREWVEQAIAHLANTPATRGLVDDQAMLHTVTPSGQAVGRLLEFWRQRTDDGTTLVHDFTEPELDTRFLGDLYQDLSDHAKKTYALLQTPEFVEEFILDRTLEPALNDRPLDGFKMIDPACGSGHFLLGSFRRILARWQAEAPALGPRERVELALDAVWGVDINPFAAAIAVFRLTVAALNAIDHASLETAPGFKINVLAGDSLWFSRVKEGLFQTQSEFAYSTEHKEALIEALRSGQYDAVVANPPYITVKDKALNAGYRERFSHLKGKYQLTAPFMELLFQLAKRGDGVTQAGWAGQITSNAFMKREFGTPLVEDLLSDLDLRLVIDTSGAYIPGHGTPTVILVGRNQTPALIYVRTVLGVEGEPGHPGDPEHGFVWRSIAKGLDQPGYADRWTNVVDLERRSLERHPWSLSGGGALSLLECLESNPRGRLAAFTLRVGIFGVMGSDDSMIIPGHVPSQFDLESAATTPLVIGEAVRDFRVGASAQAWFPYSEQHELLSIERFPAWAKRLWRTRTELGNRATFTKGTYFTDGRPFYEWHQLPRDHGSHAWTITYAEVSTHNHFVLERTRVAFGRTAPVIKLSARATEDDHLQMVGVLNSSTACFWLKQKCHDKGIRGEGGGFTPTDWERFYQFNGTQVRDFPLPRSLPLERATTLDYLAQGLSAERVDVLIVSALPSAEMLANARNRQASLRGQMIAHQEELDWEVYASYGLLDETLVHDGEPPEIALGERAFEIVLARRIAAGEDGAVWFERHGSTPITEIPDHWPVDYRELVQRRIEAIESVDAIRLLEAPEYKRRWATEPFEKQADRALRGWLLDRLEDRSLWFTSQGQVRPQSVSQLADTLGRDPEFRSVVDLWQGRRDTDLEAALTSLVQTEAVPYLAALRLKESGLRKFADWQRTWDLQRREDAGEVSTSSTGSGIPVPPKYGSGDFRKTSYWQARGKLDVPKERFILYPGAGRETDPTPLLGWAGWDHAQQSLALATILHERIAEGAPDTQLVPLVAGLAELQPWVEQWHSELDPTFGVSPAQFAREQLSEHLKSLGLTIDDLAAWRPPAPTRGRRAAK
jgi:hypothetical protein